MSESVHLAERLSRLEASLRRTQFFAGVLAASLSALVVLLTIQGRDASSAFAQDPQPKTAESKSMEMEQLSVKRLTAETAYVRWLAVVESLPPSDMGTGDPIKDGLAEWGFVDGQARVRISPTQIDFRNDRLVLKSTPQDPGPVIELRDHDRKLRTTIGATSTVGPLTGKRTDWPESTIMLRDKMGTLLYQAPQ